MEHVDNICRFLPCIPILNFTITEILMFEHFTTISVGKFHHNYVLDLYCMSFLGCAAEI